MSFRVPDLSLLVASVSVLVCFCLHALITRNVDLKASVIEFSEDSCSISQGTSSILSSSTCHTQNHVKPGSCLRSLAGAFNDVVGARGSNNTGKKTTQLDFTIFNLSLISAQAEMSHTEVKQSVGPFALDQKLQVCA